MKIQLLIAAAESDYSEFLSNVLSTKHSDTFSVGICSSKEKLSSVLTTKKYDIVLAESEWISEIPVENTKLILALWSEHTPHTDLMPDIKKVRKYQRISSIVSDMLEFYSHVATTSGSPDRTGGKIVAVWSPAGGVGKTSVALAYATRKVSQGFKVTYLDLEHFSGTDAYFSGEGKSISTLFEKLSTNANLLAKSLRQYDTGSGISYFMPPNNYDDINELTVEDVIKVINVCAVDCDFLVIDLPSVCDKRTQAIFDVAAVILLVSDGSHSTGAKMNLFCSQHCVFDDNRHKMHLIFNMSASGTDSRFETAARLPRVQTTSAVSIFKALSGNSGLDI
jgi:MinD-like ATPase involved in chromosome partitioning or flagellar assembly